MGVGEQHHTPATLPLGKSPDIHCKGGWVGPVPVWMGVISPHWDLFPTTQPIVSHCQ